MKYKLNTSSKLPNQDLKSSTKFGPLMLNKNHQSWKSSWLCHSTSGHMTTVPIAPRGYQPRNKVV